MKYFKKYLFNLFTNITAISEFSRSTQYAVYILIPCFTFTILDLNYSIDDNMLIIFMLCVQICICKPLDMKHTIIIIILVDKCYYNNIRKANIRKIISYKMDQHSESVSVQYDYSLILCDDNRYVYNYYKYILLKNNEIILISAL